MEDLPVGSEITLKVVEINKKVVLAASLTIYAAVFMIVFAEALYVRQTIEKTKRMFNSKE